MDSPLLDSGDLGKRKEMLIEMKIISTAMCTLRKHNIINLGK